jgi:sterol desaturase/sphingolipid hydroxylase (fatty acid hydroxylase superfamily)
MDAQSDFFLLRMLLAVGGLALFLGLEWWAPFRVPVQSKLHHVATNLTVIGGNLVLLNLLFGSALLLWSSHVQSQSWGLLHQLSIGPVPQVLASLVLLDLLTFGVHWANHRVPFLWRFHRAHHSDLDLDVSSGFRFHFGELIISTGIKGVSTIALGVSPLGLFLSEAWLLAGAQFQHSNFKLPERLERGIRLVLVTPHMHWIHHSRRIQEHNSNFGTMLSGWDRLIGTYCLEAPRTEVQLGLNAYPSPEHVGVVRLCLMPLGEGCRWLPSVRRVKLPAEV